MRQIRKDGNPYHPIQPQPRCPKRGPQGGRCPRVVRHPGDRFCHHHQAQWEIGGYTFGRRYRATCRWRGPRGGVCLIRAEPDKLYCRRHV